MRFVSLALGYDHELDYDFAHGASLIDPDGVRAAGGPGAVRGVDPGEESYDGRLRHVVMLDPEGDEFCIA